MGQGKWYSQFFHKAHANLSAHTKCKHTFHSFQCRSQHKLIGIAALLTDAAKIRKQEEEEEKKSWHVREKVTVNLLKKIHLN